MPTSLNLLLLEDSPQDAELILDVLQEAGFDVSARRVDSEADYLRALEHPPEIILSDFSMPHFTALDALRLMKDRGLDTPVIVVSGCIGEEMAVECMRAGATDYLLKDRLARLGHSISQALDHTRLVEEKRLTEQRLQLETFYDSLTGLPNRALFLDRLDRAFQQYRRHPSQLFAVLYLNFDAFRVVRDSVGSVATDGLLIEVGHRMLFRVRSVDTVARMEGDEFAFLLDNIKAVGNVTHVAKRLQDEVARPFSVEGRQVVLSASIGIVCCTAEYERGDHLLRDSMTAMHQARAISRAGFMIFDRAMHDQAMTRLKLEADLRQALEREEFYLEYQPIVALQSGHVAGFEALLRWRHPEDGPASPAEFLDVAMELGLMTKIGEWSLREACRQLRIWQQQFPHIRPLTMSVNFSLHQFVEMDLATLIDTTLRTTGLDAASLKIEITESDMMENPDVITQVLRQLESQRIQICLDDFGTGYSSLSYLQQLPMTFLKIDQAFVQRLGTDDDSIAIVKTIIVLAHQLGRQVIAEGVETAEHLTILRMLGCEYAQGYLFAKPLPDTQVSSLLASGHCW